MYRRGVVIEVDAARARARVRFPDRDGVESGWLEVLQRQVGDTVDYGVPDLGELVAVLMDERDEAGCILGAVYTSTRKPSSPNADVRRVSFGDGTSIAYNRATHRLTITLGEGAQVVIAGGATGAARADRVLAALQALKNAVTAAATTEAGGGGMNGMTALKAQLTTWLTEPATEPLGSEVVKLD